MSSIDNLDIHVGIFEEYERSLSYFSDVGDFDWPETIEVKRATINRPNIKQTPVDILEKTAVANKLDIKLYQHCKPSSWFVLKNLLLIKLSIKEVKQILLSRIPCGTVF